MTLRWASVPVWPLSSAYAIGKVCSVEQVVSAGHGVIGLEPVDRAEVTIVVDNFVDLLMAGTGGVRRYLVADFGGRDQLIAEHGFSALITV